MAQQIAMRLDNVSKTFGRGKRQIRAVQNVSLTVEAGQVYGLLGPNGAGKTTTIRMLLGLIRPTAGRAIIFGMDNSYQLAEILPRIGAIGGH